MKKRILSMILAIALFCALLPAANAASGFSDVPDGAWYADAVEYAVENKLMNGVGNGKFDPDGSMTRAMLVTVLWRFEGSPEKGTNNFNDVPAGEWYTKAVAWAAAEGVVNGVGGGKFDPNGKITREQMATILYRYAQKKDFDTSARGNLNIFPDQNRISDYAKTPLLWVVGEGIINGSDGKLLPQGDATRAQVATILMRFIKGAKPAEPADDTLRVALITDYGDIDDHSFNQAVYEAGKAWCEENGVDFTYYKPGDIYTEHYVAMIEQAVSDGYNVLLLPGYFFVEAILETCYKYPDVRFIALDVYESDFGYWDDDWNWHQMAIPENVFAAGYREEIAGYMAGYAAVRLGNKKLGFLGGMQTPAVVRYGYGFVQGADQAAKELSITGQVSVKYVYGGQFFGDDDITAYMNGWYAGGTQVVFACGGGIYTSAADAAITHGGKIIGVDVDQSAFFEKDITLTSAMKGLGATVSYALEELIGKNDWDAVSGAKVLGLSSEDPAEAFVCLPDSTQWNAGFTKDDYAALIGRLYRGELAVSAAIDDVPAVAISVDYQGNIKGFG